MFSRQNSTFTVYEVFPRKPQCLRGLLKLNLALVIEVNHDLEIDALLSSTGSSAGILKVGSESLTLGNANTYGGVTNVNEGSLLVNGSHFGGGAYNVNNGAILGGTGAIFSNVNLTSGTIALGTESTTGTLSATAAVFDDQSKLSIEIASESDFDQLLLSSTMSVESGATLELLLLDGFAPAIGDQFDIIDFGSSAGEFDTSLIPSLSEGQWDFSQLSSQGIISVVEVSNVMLGDCNEDGVVNFSDISSFITILTSGTYFEAADCNQDNVVDFADIASFINILNGG